MIKKFTNKLFTRKSVNNVETQASPVRSDMGSSENSSFVSTDNVEAVENSQEEKGKRWSFDKALYYALIFLTPIFFLPLTFSPVFANKQIMVGVLLLVGVIYLLARFLSNGKLEFPKTPRLYAVKALFLVVLVSTLFSQARSVSFLSNSSDSLFWVAMYGLSFILGVIILRDKKSVVTSAFAYLASMGLLTLFALLQFSGIKIFPYDFAQADNFSMAGSAFAVGFIVTAAFCALLSFLIIVNIENKKLKIGLWSLLGLFALLVLQMNFTSIWLTLALTFVVISVVVGYSYVRSNQVSFQPLLIPFFVIIISLLGVFIGFKVPSFISLPLEVGPTFSTTLDITKNALSGPQVIYGTGPGTFPYSYSQFRPESINNTQFWGVQFGQGYSSFLTNVSTLGLLGTLATLFVLFVFYKTLLVGIMSKVRGKTNNVVHGIALGAFAASLFFGISTFVYKANSVMYMLLFISAAIGISALYNMGVLKKFRFTLTNSPKVMLVSSVGIILIISTALGAIYFVSQNYLAQLYAAQGVLKFRESGDIDGALVKLDRAIKANKDDDTILRVGSQALMVKAGKIANDQTLTTEVRSTNLTNAFQNAVSIARSATQINPKSTQNWLELARVYEQVVGIATGAEDLAVEAYQKARELDPFNPSLPLGQARVYVALSDVLQNRLTTAGAANQPQIAQQRSSALSFATDRVNESLALKSDYVNASFLLAGIYQRQGNLDAALVQTRKIASENPNNSSLAFQLGLFHYQADNFSEARTLLERAVALASGNFGNARFYLGLTLDKLGEINLAIGQFERVLENNQDSVLTKGALANLRAGRPALEGLESSTTSAPIPDTGGAEQPVLP